MKNNNSIIEKILLSVEKPGRYSGGERNQFLKKDAKFRFVMSYPDRYEVGMANNGIKIIYEMLNEIEDVACERVFVPALDFETELKNNSIPLFTLESRTPLKECDMIGFNYSHELLATNIFHILSLSGISVDRNERSENDPIIIIGGECSSNPLPLSFAADIFFAGEAEDNLTEIVQHIFELKKKGIPKNEIIASLEKFDNLFVPANSQIKELSGGIKSYDAKPVRKAFFRGDLQYPKKSLVPLIAISQEKSVTEIARGCRNMCCFCHAGFCTMPYREYSEEVIFQNIKNQIKNTGLNEVTLSALSVSDYTRIDSLINTIMPFINENAYSVSLPSMKVDKTNLPLIKAVSDVRQSSITFAVETADDYLRRKIHKKLSMDDLYEIIGEVFRNGWNLIKLYFMIGLPGYKEHDEAESIIQALSKINEIGGRRKKINVTISPFVPKPHTPFECDEFASSEYLLETVFKIKRALPKNISIKNHDIFVSRLEAVISRGDASLGPALHEAYKRGAYMDSWDEFIRKDIWEDIIKEYNLESYLNEREVIPWEFVQASNRKIISYKKENLMSSERLSSRKRELSIDREKLKESFEKFKVRYNSEGNYRLTFQKKDTAKYFSHNDMLDHIRRAFTSASFPVSYTQGFNKHEKISASFPIPLGIESECELIDAEVYTSFDCDEMKRSINESLPAGLTLLSIDKTAKANLMRIGASSVYQIKNADNEKMKAYLESDSVYMKESKGKVREISVKEAVLNYEFKDDAAQVEILCGSIRIDDFIRMFGEDGVVKCVKIKQNI